MQNSIEITRCTCVECMKHPQDKRFAVDDRPHQERDYYLSDLLDASNALLAKLRDHEKIYDYQGLSMLFHMTEAECHRQETRANKKLKRILERIEALDEEFG